ncbi:MAG: Unknown protein [uncultured Thiotrichaceae bacterium]|uniref:DUF2809 domain-containing protein n=1 Tax=uncultured Thiotrichaceae bacterium TaxID=298394 RepID=A0A6S6SP43_9GAMM|nr:MAG: Unknown protein [uncultured Thiotrichaceae bacterium]
MTSKSLYIILAILLFITEVIIATALKEHVFIRAYFGDFLVVILLFCIAKAIYAFNALYLAIAVFAFATLIEIAQFFHIADALGLAEGGIARIVLGTSFSVHDLLMYAIGCVAAYILDRFLINPKFRQPEVL